MLYIATLLLFLAAMLLMAVGVMLGRRPLSGGCTPSRDCACARRLGLAPAAEAERRRGSSERLR